MLVGRDGRRRVQSGMIIEETTGGASSRASGPGRPRYARTLGSACGSSPFRDSHTLSIDRDETNRLGPVFSLGWRAGLDPVVPLLAGEDPPEGPSRT